MMRGFWVVCPLSVLLLSVWVVGHSEESEEVQLLRPVIINTYPHDPGAFTQGLEYHEGVLYESTGLYGQSSLREVDIQTGQVLRLAQIPQTHFGEGITVVGDQIHMLTWRQGDGIIFNRHDFRGIGGFTYDGEGWGLCYDGQYLVKSNGTHRLTLHEVGSFNEVSSRTVTYKGGALSSLNELEYAEDHIWANVWKTDYIMKIDPDTGNVVARVDCSGLLTEEEAEDADVLNGITYIPSSKTYLITGKLWPKMFEVIFEPVQQ